MISPAYRLGPQVTIDDQVQDSIESIKWCREHLPGILGRDKVDVDRYVICGESAGGVLVTLMGIHLSPPPRAIIDVYGVVDFLDPYMNRQRRQDLPFWHGEFTVEEIKELLADRDRANCLTDSLSWNEDEKCSEEKISELWATDFKYNRRIRLQKALHQYCSIRGNPNSHQGERFKTPEERPHWLKSVSALHLLDATSTYPPTAFLHGTADEAVPLEQSKKMAEKLREMGVLTVECYAPGGPHVFDNVYTVSLKLKHALTFGRIQTCPAGTLTFSLYWISPTNTSD